MAKTYTTQQGDAWDAIAHKVYGSETYTGWLMQNNLPLLDIFVFEAGTVLGRYWSGNNKPPEGAEGLFRKDLGRTPGEAMIRYDGSTLTIQCAGAIHIEAGGAVTINGATIDLN